MEFSTDNQNFAREPITESSLDQIRKSSGWIKFIAILTILGSAIIALVGLFLAFAGNSNIFAEMAEKSPQFAYMGLLGKMGIILAIIIIIIAGIYFYMGLLTHRVGQAASLPTYNDVNHDIQNYANNFSNYLIFTFVFGILGIIITIFTTISAL